MTDPAPIPEPLSIDEVKLNLRVDDGAEDALITALIIAAREYVEDFTGLVLTPRTVTETARSLGTWIELTSWPVRAVTAIRYPLADEMAEMDEGAWLLSPARRPVRLLPASAGWGVGSAPGGVAALPVEIDVSAGFEDPADVPQTIKQAMHLLIAHLYTNRSAVDVRNGAGAIEVPFGVEALLQRWRLALV